MSRLWRTKGDRLKESKEIQHLNAVRDPELEPRVATPNPDPAAQRILSELGMVTHACDSSIQETEPGEFWAWSQTRLQSNFKCLFLNKEHYWENKYKLNKAYIFNNSTISTLVFYFCFLNWFYISLCVLVCIRKWASTHECRRPWKPEGHLDTLELEWQAVVSNVSPGTKTQALCFESSICS